MSDNHKRTALVTGGNRGIGLDVCRSSHGTVHPTFERTDE